jgi:hypothetical protein
LARSGACIHLCYSFPVYLYCCTKSQANINVRAIAQGCSEYNITVVLKEEDCIRALRAAHSRFYLSKTMLAVGVIGPGLIGGTLLDQLRDQVKNNSIFYIGVGMVVDTTFENLISSKTNA